MNNFGPIFALFIASFAAPIFLVAQEDASRESGLPSMIGGSRCTNLRAGADATIAGSLSVQGLTNSTEQPSLSVALYAGGAFISRQRVKNGGTFTFYCSPHGSVQLTAEVDSVEVGNYALGQISGPPIVNRQEMFVVWNKAKAENERRNEVISAKYFYKRNDENQKLFNKAMDGMRENKGAESAKLLKKLLEKDEQDYIAWTLLGDIYFNGSRFSDADAAYEKAVALKKDFVPSSIGAGRANYALRAFDRSIEILSAADTAHPNSSDVNHYLAEAYLQVRKGTLAIAHFRKAIELAPDEKAELHLRIATLYNAAGAKNLAADEYKLFLEKRPNYAERKELEKYISENAR